MDKAPLLQNQHKQNGTTEGRFRASQKRIENAYTGWKRLLDYYQDNPMAPVAFVLLTSQRQTNATIDEISSDLDLDPWETLAALQAAEEKLATSSDFAGRFAKFLDGFQGDDRDQAFTVGDAYAMTYEEIGEKEGLAWQRVQQIERRALAKIRRALRRDPDMAFEILDLLGLPREVAFNLNN